MTKEELLRIYSAYLPYKTKCYCMGEYGEDNNPFIFEIVGITHGSVEVIQCSTTNITHFEPEEIFPILYPLEFLTKEIEHEGETIIPIVEILKQASLLDLNGCKFDIYDDEEEDNGIYVNAEDEHGRVIDAIFYDGNIFQKMHGYGFEPVNPQRELQEMLYRYHFNVFQLPESEYINKATLKS